ncbi:hypothetical protein COCCADRAFT_41815 [Bipolaris zeicola 26-R-13]|uniref:Uncharacterized protein n=1 Tax=Cochliobolus carbonum (strain 26-R-13) TaxID=930089 RepID=W6XXI2_COCC2|nr:uncharacterized protein COCCADRAFT_41815 [Bipolaris zeicola 26-R-13]EUC27459.1 hypothetical protein COCCADRAFT_41815 [Bipolaris zeicola 26-R-13]
MFATFVTIKTPPGESIEVIAITALLHSAATIVVFAALSAIVIQILCTSTYTDSGILTLKFNFTDALTDALPSPTHALRDRDLLEDLQDGVRSGLNAAATRVADAAGRAESAISSAAATVQSIEDIVPKNCSLGIRRFCIGFEQDINCSDLPLNFSRLLPDGMQKLPSSIQDAIKDRAESLSQLVETSNKFPVFSVPDTLISGLVLMSVVTRVFGIFKAVPRALSLLALGLLCCSPFVLLGVILHTILSAADKLPSWVRVEVGEVCGLSFAALACALLLALIIPIAPSAAVPVKMEDAKAKE